MEHWIIAPVILPVVAAAILVIGARHDLGLQRILSGAATVAFVALSLALLAAASGADPEVYTLGNWPAPFGITLVLDRLSALMLVLTAVLALAVWLYATGTGWDARGRHFHPLLQFQLMGLAGAFLTGDAFNLFVFFEVLLIASYGLMIHGGGRDRMRAGVQYVALNLVGSTLFLFALGTIYAVTGTLNMADLAGKVATLPEGDVAILRVGAVLLMLVFAVKGALVPLHFWLPGTYAHAPGPVAALFAVMTKVGAYSALRFATLVFPPEAPAIGGLWGPALLGAGLVTLAVGAIGVLGAGRLARLAAFAAIASMGTLFAAMSGLTPAATTAALYYMVHSTLATAALFLVTDLVVARRGDDTLTRPLPPIAQNGLIAALFMVSAIAMAGMPPLSGFLGKLLVMDALRGAAGLVWPVILIASFLMILGFARAGSVLFWKAHATGEPAEDGPAPSVAGFAAVGILAGTLVLLTIAAGPVTGWLEATATALHDPSAYIAAHSLPEVR